VIFRLKQAIEEHLKLFVTILMCFRLKEDISSYKEGYSELKNLIFGHLKT
jgi:hypothetical protein